jgi:adenosylcobinamide-GDP ribazoletransferase
LNRSEVDEDLRSIAARDHVSGVASQHTPWWGPIAASIGFLTIFPVPRVAMSPTLSERSLALFPLVGAGIGALLGGFGIVLSHILPAGPIAALLIAAGALVSGGLHLDGLMDTADGLCGGRTPEQRLMIMRDSRVGAFAVIAGGVVILGQFACLSELTGHARFIALIVAAAMSRWAMLLALVIFPAARTSGIGATFHSGATRTACIAGTLFVILLALVSGRLGLIALVASTIAVLGCGHLLTRQLGGLTGDSYGAIAVVTETVVLFVAVALAIP